MKQKVLFLCTGNSCRSQMAEGILRYLEGDRFDVFSAGIHPSRVHPLSIKVMEEWGIDISNQTSDHVDEYLDRGIDIVITLCDHANEVCPTFPGEIERIHWSIPDPFSGWTVDDRLLHFYRATRNLIRQRIDEFLENH